MGISNQYFQRKRISIVMSPKTFSEMLRIRSLCLLSGKKLGDIPGITDFVNGIIVHFYYRLNIEILNQTRNPDLLLYIPNLKKYFGKVEIEKELNKEEYEDFVRALPEDVFISSIETIDEKPTNVDSEQLTEINIEIPPNPTSGESQQISLMLTEEMVIWARKINKLINDILHNRILYSLSDLVKTIVETVMSLQLGIAYPVEIYMAHLYNIEPKEFIKFYHGFPEVIMNDPEYRNLISVLTDKPIVDSFIEIHKKLLAVMDKPDILDNLDEMNKLLDEIDKIMDYNKLWSYVSDFNYKKAMMGLATFRLTVSSGLDMSDINVSLYHGGLESMFAKNPDLSKSLARDRIYSYVLFLVILLNFMSKVYTYASSTNR